MAVEEHPYLNEPDGAEPLWRYMDLAKFVSLLVTNKLWLSSAEVLAKEDPYEVTISELNVAEFAHEQMAEIVPDFPEKVLKLYEQIRPYVFVNCWHAAKEESVAMWKTYASYDVGIAIVSSANRMRRALRRSNESIFLGRVEYIDYQQDVIDPRNLFGPTLKKRHSFSYEREVRLIHLLGMGQPEGELRAPPAGFGIRCDLGALIERVEVSPAAEDWFVDNVRDLAKKFGLRAPVVKSTLLSPRTKQAPAASTPPKRRSRR